MNHQTTVISCIEAGPMEQQVIMMARSLRVLGTPLSKVPIIAVRPRPGPKLSRETRSILSSLDVEYRQVDLVGRYNWYPLYNKAATMAWAEQNVKTPYVTWSDSDIIFVRDVPDIIPKKGVAMVCRAGPGSLGTDGQDSNVGYWQKLSELADVDYKAADRITSIPDGRTIYEYYQSGLYSVLRAEGISQRHAALIRTAIDHKVASSDAGVYHHDQACLSMAARSSQGVRDLLPWEANFNFNMLDPDSIDRDILKRVQVLHYHGAFYPELFDLAQTFFDDLPPQTVSLIREYAPLHVKMGFSGRVERKVRNAWAKRKMREHVKACTVY